MLRILYQFSGFDRKNTTRDTSSCFCLSKFKKRSLFAQYFAGKIRQLKLESLDGWKKHERCAEDVVQNPFGCNPGKWKLSLGFPSVNMYSHPGGGGGTNPKKYKGKSNFQSWRGFWRKRSNEALREWQEFWFTGVFWMNHVKQQRNNCLKLIRPLTMKGVF